MKNPNSAQQHTIKIASVQLNSQNHLNTNQAIITQAIKTASEHGAKLVVLPENACYMGRQADIAKHFNNLKTWFETLAKTYDINLIAGTLPCPYHRDGRVLTNGKFFQTSLAINAQGDTIARYDKIHLFRATVSDSIGNYDERQSFEMGDKITYADFNIDKQTVRVGMMICFDLRFAKLAQNLRQMGVDILVAPSAFTFKTGQAHWQLLLQARALDSQCMIVGSAQGGKHKTTNSERQTWGHSTIVDANGTIQASTQTSASDNDFLISYANFDHQAQAQIRQNMPIFNCHCLA